MHCLRLNTTNLNFLIRGTGDLYSFLYFEVIMKDDMNGRDFYLIDKDVVICMIYCVNYNSLKGNKYLF